MNRFIAFAGGLGLISACSAQTLDPSLLKNSESKQGGFNWDFGADKATGKRFTIEGVFCLNGYSWSPIDYNESDATIRQAVERHVDVPECQRGWWPTNRAALASRAVPTGGNAAY
jgi:hypothetical protein